MKETNFINQKKKKWKELERLLDAPYKDPDKLNELFIQITDDLSYSRTFYPNRSVRVYLNGLAQRIFFSIYKTKRKFGWGRMVSFWTQELPKLIFESRRALLYSFLIFALAFLIGALSSAMDTEFPEVILGQRYIEMTKENINSGDPMAVYKHSGPWGMSVGITINNLWVAFLTFAMGAFFSLGSIIILLRNGIMIGAFQYFFIEQGLFRESFLTIWIHGTLEISAIIIAGAAGITMGAGLVFPGTLSRLQAFQRSARRGLKIMIGIAPIIILAGFIEGYLTRFTETPDIVRAFFIGFCLLFVLFYFVWYPHALARKGFKDNLPESPLPPDIQHELKFNTIKDSSTIFSDVFYLSRKYAGRIILGSLITSVIFCLAAFGFSEKAPTEIFLLPREFLSTINNSGQFLGAGSLSFVPFLNIGIIAILALVAFSIIRKEFGGAYWNNNLFQLFLLLLPVAALIELIFLTGAGWSFFVFLIATPVLMLWMFAIYRGKNTLNGLSYTFALINKNAGKLMAVFLLLAITSFFFLSLLDTGLAWIFLSIAEWVINFDQATMDKISVVLFTGINVFALHLVFSALLIGMGLAFFSLREINIAATLIQKIQKIGTAKRIKGLERE